MHGPIYMYLEYSKICYVLLAHSGPNLSNFDINNKIKINFDKLKVESKLKSYIDFTSTVCLK